MYKFFLILVDLLHNVFFFLFIFFYDRVIEIIISLVTAPIRPSKLINLFIINSVFMFLENALNAWYNSTERDNKSEKERRVTGNESGKGKKKK